MTELLERDLPAAAAAPKTIEKVAIVISKGSLEGIYPGLIMANGARMEGIDADIFFTFFGLDAIRKDRFAKIKVATVGNPGMHLPTLIGVAARHVVDRHQDDATPDGEARHPAHPRVHRARRRLRRTPLRLQGERRHVRPDHGRLRPPGRESLTVGEFYELAAGGEIVFT